MKRRDLLTLAAASTAGLLLPEGALGRTRRIWPVPSVPAYPEGGKHFTGGEVWGSETRGHQEAIRMLRLGMFPQTGLTPVKPEAMPTAMMNGEPCPLAAHYQAQERRRALQADPEFNRRTRQMIEKLRREFKLPAPLLDREVAALDCEDFESYQQAVAGQWPVVARREWIWRD